MTLLVQIEDPRRRVTDLDRWAKEKRWPFSTRLPEAAQIQMTTRREWILPFVFHTRRLNDEDCASVREQADLILRRRYFGFSSSFYRDHARLFTRGGAVMLSLRTTKPDAQNGQ
jgi:hypothetical protein